MRPRLRSEAAVLRLADDPLIEQILVWVDNSPGGVITGIEAASDAIYEARQVKPVIGFASDLAGIGCLLAS